MSTILHELMTLGLTPHERQLESQLRRRLDEEFMRSRRRHHRNAIRQIQSLPKWLRGKAKKEILDLRKPDRRRTRANRELLDFLTFSIRNELRCVEELKIANRDFRQSYALTVGREEKKRILLDYAKSLGRSPRDLKGDASACDRFLDEAAMNQRCQRQVGEREQYIEYKLKRLGHLVRHTLGLIDVSETSVRGFWKRLGIEPIMHEVLDHPGDVRLRRAAIKSLRMAVQGMPRSIATNILLETTVQRARSLAEDRSADVWMQTEALQLMCQCAPEEGDELLRDRLTNVDTGDDRFVRRAAIRSLSLRISHAPRLSELFSSVAHDPSAFVRQQLPSAVLRASMDVAEYWLHHLLLDEENAKVRAATLRELLDAPPVWSPNRYVLQMLSKVLDQERDEFVLRVALHVSAEWLCRSIKAVQSDGKRIDRRELESIYGRELLPQLRQLQSSAESIRVRRWACQAAERIWCELDHSARQLRDTLQPIVESIPVGKSKPIASQLLVENDAATFGRVLALLSQNDFGLDLRAGWRGYRIQRGPTFGARWWRVIHEWRRPATDKRQAVSHTIGRVSRGVIRAPSSVLSEISQTKVPGEPLYIPNEGGWRPYLPLLDDFLSVLDLKTWRAGTVRFFSPQGITEVTAPRRFPQRLRAALRITWSFEHLAALRNYRDEENRPAHGYIEALRDQGFDIQFRPHPDRWTPEDGEVDPSVTRFFSPFLALSLPQWADATGRLARQFVDYFGSVFENSLAELVIFAVALLVLFFARSFLSSKRVRGARRKIALSLGGWGTRGKSGTERLKAALIGSLGYSLVSKTTGCEAMFLRGETFGETREFPLFRPFDKATIWEHHNVLSMAGRMDTSVFLWECMALNPVYVEVLQRHWTQDDLATIVNAYPDHEDIQGPAGWNVASVIAGFAPSNARVLTTEQQMMPILRDVAEQAGSSIRQLGWMEAGMLTEEVLARFPYQEHPDNVALVLEMGRELGIDPDFALKEMADWLIADLGVLRTYPVAELGFKRLEFTNGCSANERFGCLGNWERTGFADHDPADQPEIQITTVVNNRADRVARSKVFASILVNDLSADRHVLIGTNLKGLMGFIDESWENRMDGFSLWSRTDSSPLERFTALAREMRQVTSEEQVQVGLKVMLQATIDEHLLEHWEQPGLLKVELEKRKVDPVTVEEIIHHHQWLLRSYQEYQSFAGLLERMPGERQPEQDAKCVQLLKTWFHRKLVVLNNEHLTGEQIIHQLESQTPPGFLNRVMGLQNIKGTGLDFVYRWQAWQQCHAACEALLSAHHAAAAKGLAFLGSQSSFGLLCQQKVADTLRRLRSEVNLRRRQDDLDLERIESKLADSKHGAQLDAEAGHQAPGRRLADTMVQLAEGFFDLLDGVRRRRRADRIYQDLIKQRISAEMAVTELRRINQQQKGGWIRDRFTVTVDESDTKSPTIDSFGPEAAQPHDGQIEETLQPIN